LKPDDTVGEHLNFCAIQERALPLDCLAGSVVKKDFDQRVLKWVHARSVLRLGVQAFGERVGFRRKGRIVANWLLVRATPASDCDQETAKSQLQFDGTHELLDAARDSTEMPQRESKHFVVKYMR
jgi:hypothetical protein